MVKWSVVHRPNDVGIDLPAGASAKDLEPTDYHLVEMNDRGTGEERPAPRARSSRRRS
jgi:hypothetical protein